MKKFLLELIGTVILVFVAIPCVVIGMCIGAAIYQHNMEPQFEKN